MYNIDDITLESYVSLNYIGYFVTGDSFKNLKYIAKRLVNALSFEGNILY